MDCIVIFAGENLSKINSCYLGSKIDEVKSLAKTLGWKVLDVIVVNLRSVDPGFYITKGKLLQIKSLPQMSNVDCIVFYNDLSPVQIRNLEREFGKKVITRVDLILTIFKNHAVSKEAKLQIELATLQVYLPRLYGIGKEMEQMKGGIGLRGPGERKTEIMKRHVKEKIRLLKKKIQEIKKNRFVQFEGRKGVFNVSIVGYTNSGKSTFINAITKANVLEKDELFSTLDTKTKRLFIDGIYLTVTDTVGFIEDLPHQLIESFYSTLEVVKRSNLLLHVVDISSSFVEEKIKVVDGVIREIFSKDNLEVPEIFYVFNKIDILQNIDLINEFECKYPNSLFISAKEKINLDKVKEKLKEFAQNYYSLVSWLF